MGQAEGLALLGLWEGHLLSVVTALAAQELNQVG